MAAALLVAQEIELVPSRIRKFDLDQVVTLALTIMGVGIMVGGVRLKIGTISVPEPGFFPFVSGTMVAVLSLCRMVASISRKTLEGEALKKADVPWKAMALAVTLTVYTLALDWLGFIIATSLLAVAVMRIAHRQSWITTIAISIGLAAGSYCLFSRLLKVSLPPGSLF